MVGSIVLLSGSPLQLFNRLVLSTVLLLYGIVLLLLCGIVLLLSLLDGIGLLLLGGRVTMSQCLKG